jgi:hypothetical protein
MKINTQDFKNYPGKNLENSALEFFYGDSKNQVTLNKNASSYSLMNAFLRSGTDAL